MTKEAKPNPLKDALVGQLEERERPKAVVAQEEREERAAQSNVTPARRGKRAVTVYIAPDTHRSLRQLSLDVDTPLSTLLVEAVDDLLGKYRGDIEDPP